jgi:hypothetical protein
MPGLPDTTDDRLNHLGKLMHEQDDEQMARIQRLEERQGFLLSAVAQLQRYLPKDIMPVPICDVGEGISDAQAIAALLNAADVAGQIEQGKGTGTYTGDLND